MSEIREGACAHENWSGCSAVEHEISRDFPILQLKEREEAR